MSDSRFLHVNLEDLLVRLTATALKWFKQRRCYQRDAVLPGTGTSAEDLAQNALLEVLMDDSLWKPKTPDEDPFPLLITIMKHDFLDLIKSSGYKTTDVIDIQEQDDDRDGYISATAAILARQMHSIVDHDPALTDFIDAVLLFGLHKREDIAELLGITPRQASERRAKLRVLLASWRESVSPPTKGE
jgi:DNA-directed RNA polymerase specialized sigma24 family protein